MVGTRVMISPKVIGFGARVVLWIWWMAISAERESGEYLGGLIPEEERTLSRMFLCLFGWKKVGIPLSFYIVAHLSDTACNKNDHPDSDVCKQMFITGELYSCREELVRSRREHRRFRDEENGSWKNCRGVEWGVLVVEIGTEHGNRNTTTKPAQFQCPSIFPSQVRVGRFVAR